MTLMQELIARGRRGAWDTARLRAVTQVILVASIVVLLFIGLVTMADGGSSLVGVTVLVAAVPFGVLLVQLMRE